MDCCAVNSFAISTQDSVLQVASLFHANGWGMPFTAAMAGAKVVLPGPFADAEGILDLMEKEKVTAALGVPTVFFGVLDALDRHPGRWKLNLADPIASGRCGFLRSADARIRAPRDHRHQPVRHDGDDAARYVFPPATAHAGLER